jgi:hypothetical protein
MSQNNNDKLNALIRNTLETHACWKSLHCAIASLTQWYLPKDGGKNPKPLIPNLTKKEDRKRGNRQNRARKKLVGLIQPNRVLRKKGIDENEKWKGWQLCHIWDGKGHGDAKTYSNIANLVFLPKALAGLTEESMPSVKAMLKCRSQKLYKWAPHNNKKKEWVREPEWYPKDSIWEDTIAEIRQKQPKGKRKT